MTNVFPIQRNQTCVYWAASQPDGYGGYTYANPVELKCRWQNVNQTIMNKESEEILCRAIVFVGQDIDDQGRLKLTTLAELSTAEQADPIAARAYIIQRVDKTPSISKPTRYVWRVYL